METILASRDGGQAGELVAVWARRLSRGRRRGVRWAPPCAARRVLLDLARKRDADWLVMALGDARPATGDARPAARLDDDLALLLAGAPCPVLSVQPWVPAQRSPTRLAVVGVDRSPAAYAAARAAGRALRALGAPARLLLAHGCATHPAELAAATSWSALTERMRGEQESWLEVLARELRSPGLSVDVVARLVFAPDLIAGVAQQLDADFAALGAAPRPEGSGARLGRIQRRVLRATPCPVLTAAAPPFVERAAAPPCFA